LVNISYCSHKHTKRNKIAQNEANRLAKCILEWFRDAKNVNN